MEKKKSTWSEVVKSFKKLPISEQEAVQNFFNLHNAAIWIYNFLTDDAKTYVDEAINFSQAMDEDSNALETAVINDNPSFPAGKNGEQFM